MIQIQVRPASVFARTGREGAVVEFAFGQRSTELPFAAQAFPMPAYFTGGSASLIKIN